MTILEKSAKALAVAGVSLVLVSSSAFAGGPVDAGGGPTATACEKSGGKAKGCPPPSTGGDPVVWVFN